MPFTHPPIPPPIADLWTRATASLDECLSAVAALPSATPEDASPAAKTLCERLKALSMAVGCLRQIQDAQRKLSQENPLEPDSDTGDAEVPAQFQEDLERLLEQMQRSLGPDAHGQPPEDTLPA